MTELEEPDRDLLVASLLQPSAYPHPVSGRVEHISTHISDVFLAGDFAYKVKKPVNLGFCDFSTAELRERFSRRELELNQRLTDGVYLSIEPVAFDVATEGYSVAGDGTPVDVALKMRRLRSEDQLDRHIANGDAGIEEIGQIAGLLADFHGSAPAAPPQFGTVEAVSNIVLGNLDRVVEHAQPELDRGALANIRAYSTQFLEQRGDLITARHTARKPRMCHGDLHAANIFLELHTGRARKTQIIDCIEFNDSFVYIDPAADLAFLSMDLKRLGHPELARVLLESYVEASGDARIWPLMPFYETYRAMVRCMASSIMAGESSGEDKARNQSLADSYLALAGEISSQERPQFLAITAGVTGTGKSTVAKPIAGAWGAVHLQTDAIRRELAGIGPTERSGSDVFGGIYTREMSQRTYEEMHRRARAALADGRSVIMDGTHLQRRFRRQSLEIGRAAGATTIVVECSLSDAKTVQRLVSRYASGTSESEGRPEVHANQVKYWQPVADDEADGVARVETGGTIEDLPRQVFTELWRAVFDATGTGEPT